MNPNEIARLVKYYRKESGLSQKELAKIAGLGKTVIFDVEKGKATVQLDTLLKVLEVLNIQIKFETPFPEPRQSKI